METENDDTLFQRLSKLDRFIEKNSEVHFEPLMNVFPVCVKFGLARAFAFAKFASQHNFETAFFIVPALRPITEDLIVFRFLEQTATAEERENLVQNLMVLDVQENLKHQSMFFRKFRPFQHVLSSFRDGDRQEKESKSQLTNFWRQNGWPNLGKNVKLPPIRQIALKSEPGILEVVYDFFYRLASGEVHSSPRTLLRLGWQITENPNEAVLKSGFSIKQLGNYYLALAQIYGSYLFCLWFEFFSAHYEVSEDDLKQISSVRAYLLEQVQWPEIVTFEEMNVPRPDSEATFWSRVLVSALYKKISEDGFVDGIRLILESGKLANKDKQ